jgi:hypothetical protein
MTPRNVRFHHLAAVAVLLASCGFTIVCTRTLVLREGARPGFDYRPLIPGDRNSPRDWFFRLQGQREGGRTIAIAPFSIAQGPFWFEGEGGISDPALIAQSSDSYSCFEIFEDGHFGDVAYSFAFCGRYVSGGYQVFNSENADNRFYPGVYVLQFRIEYDGADLSYLTRPVGAQTWDTVTTVPLSYDTRMIPSMGAIGMHKGGVYDVLDLKWSTTPPVDPTAEERYGWHVQEAYRFDLSALERIENSDFGGANADLGSARDQLVQALGEVPSFVDARIGKQTARYTIRADQRLEKAQRKTTDQNATAAVLQLLLSLADQGNGFQRVAGRDYRPLF